MEDKDKLLDIIKDFLDNASEEEIAELTHLLSERGKSGKNILDINRSAKEISARIMDQMGITNENIKRTARDLVVQMAMQYKPDISYEELKAITHLMVPNEKIKPGLNRLPSEILLSMLDHFISYSLGRMPESKKKQLPEGWIEKYWFSFSEEIQILVSALIKNRISEKEFWDEILKITGK